MINKVNLKEKLAQFDEHWSPKIAGALNDQYVKLVKFKGEYVWHHHENEDELFLVIKGSMNLELKNSTIQIDEGEFIIVPRGVEHRPVAAEECQVLLLEPQATRNTGNVDHDYTIEADNLDKI